MKKRPAIAKPSIRPHGLAGAIVFLVSVATLLGFAGRQSYVADLLAQFRIQYALLLAVALVYCCFTRRVKTGAIVCLMLAINLGLILPYFVGGQVEPRDASCRLLVFNVKSSNDQHVEFIQFVQEQNPDLVVLLEINDRWAQALRPLDGDYVYQYIRPRSDNFGIAIVSKIPLDSVQAESYSSSQVPSLNVLFKIESKTVQLIATHPIPPLRQASYVSRNEQLAKALDSLDSDLPHLLVGDFNLTPWSPHFSDLLARGDLTDSALGFGIQPTWNAFPSWLGGLRLDHALVSSDIGIVKYQIGPHLGSDHRPVVVDFFVSKNALDSGHGRR